MRSPTEFKWHEVWYSPLSEEGLDITVESAGMGERVLFRASTTLRNQNQVNKVFYPR